MNNENDTLSRATQAAKQTPKNIEISNTDDRLLAKKDELQVILDRIEKSNGLEASILKSIDGAKAKLTELHEKFKQEELIGAPKLKALRDGNQDRIDELKVQTGKYGSAKSNADGARVKLEEQEVKTKQAERDLEARLKQFTDYMQKLEVKETKLDNKENWLAEWEVRLKKIESNASQKEKTKK